MPRKSAKDRRNAKKKAAQAVQEEKAKAEDTLKMKGNKAFAEKNYPKALEMYNAAIEEDQKDEKLYSNRAATFLEMKDFPKALEDANSAISIAPEWPKGYLRRGLAYLELLRYPEAKEAFTEGLVKDPKDASLTKAANELASLLDELKITESELNKSNPANPDTDKFSLMVKWLKDGGGKFPKLYLQYYSEDYRGVHCLTKVPADDVMLFVPHKYIMTSEVAKGSEMGKKIISSGVDLRSKHSYLASYLLQEKHKKKSFWDPYLNILPEYYANMPLSFDEEELGWLKGSFSLQKIADRIDSLRREYDSIRRAVPAFAKFTHVDFVWARLVVITRIFGLVIEGNKTDGLVPYADMLNHRRPRESKWTFDDGRYGFIITSLKSIPRGAQVYDSYGRKCNSRFFVNYGFSLDVNEDNEVVMRVQLPASDPHYNMKIRFLGGREINAKREFQVPCNYKEKKCKELFSFLRYIHAVDSELMLLSSGEGFKLNEIEPISIRNEIAALTHIKQVAQGVMAGFPETLQHDRDLLASDKLVMYSNRRNCVVMRRGEKEVLQWYIDTADKAIPFLKLPWKDLKRKAAKCYQGTTSFDAYVTQVVVPLVKKET